METTQIHNQAEVKIAEYPIGKGNEGKLAIIFGGIGADSPKKVLDDAVQKYVGNEAYSEFIEIYLDNPWLRVVIKGIKDPDQFDFKDFEQFTKGLNLSA